MSISTAVPSSSRARVVGIETQFKDLRAGQILFLPQQIMVIGQGNTAATYSTDKTQVTSAFEVGTNYGFGSPLWHAVNQLLPANGDGVGTIPVTVYPLVDDASGVPSLGDITATGTATKAAAFNIVINNIISAAFTIAVGDDGIDMEDRITDAINAVLEMPVVAVADGIGNKSDLTSKWEGTSANNIVIEVVGPTDTGITFGLTQPVGGLVNPVVTAALDQVGESWETLAVNCLDLADTVTLDLYQTFGVGRWGATTKKPMVFFTGNIEADVSTAITIPDARKDDFVNSAPPSPGSNDLPCVVAAREVAKIALIADSNPARDYARQKATGLVPGADGDQWDYLERDIAVKAGQSTIEVIDGVVNLSDTVTFYHPDGDVNPAYRYVVDIIRLQTIIYNLNLIFDSEDWAGAPLIPDADPTVNPAARKPKTAKAAIWTMLDSLGLNAIISDPKTAKDNTLVEINDQNPNRLDICVTVQLSGNANIISIDLKFGFFFGTPAVLA